MRLSFRLAAASTLALAGLCAAATSTASAATGVHQPAATVTTWSSRYHGLGGYGSPYAMAVSPSGSTVFITGETYRHSSAYYGTVAYNAATGTKLWSATYPGGQGTGLAVSPDGSTLYVTGYAGTLAYNAATGAVRWTDASTPGTSVAVSPDGSTLFVANYTEVSTVSTYETGAYSTATGTSIWTADYTHPGLAMGFYTPSIAVSPDGSTVYVRGNLGASRFATLAYTAATGALRWSSYYGGGAGTNVAYAFTVSPDGSTVYVTGATYPTSAPSSYATVAYAAATGTMRWARTYKGPGKVGSSASWVAVSPDSSTVYVTGRGSETSGNYDYTTLTYNAATGATLWLKHFSGPGGVNSGPIFAGVSPDGSTLYVAGSAGTAYGTVAYNAATGAWKWTRLFKGAKATNSATAAAVSPTAAQVFVTGTSAGSSGVRYETVSYAG